MAKTIKITVNDKTYVLEYTRKTASMLEKNGFEADKLGSMANTMTTKLIHHAFLANHERMKEEKAMEIFMAIPKDDRLSVVTALTEMYADTVNTLFGTSSDDGENEPNEGNAVWEVVE